MFLRRREAGPVYAALGLSLIAFLAGSGGLWAQTTPTAITLAATTSPAAVQPGVTVATLVVSSLPAGTITASNLALAVQLASGSTGPSLSATVTSFATLPPAGGRITFQVNGPNVSAPTPYLVSVSGRTSTGTTFASSKPAAMTVNPPASIVSIVPASGQPGQTLQVTITGQFTNYVQGSTNANFGPGISVGTGSIGQSGFVTVTSATTATVQLIIAPSAVPGPRSVTVASGVQTATASAFTVTAPSASLLSITPNTGAQGQSLSVSIVGQNTHFANTSALDLGTGLTAANITTTDSTHLAAQLSIGAAAATGTRTLTVSSGTEVIVLANAFTVTPGPAITQVSPNSGQQGQTNLSVGITGQFTHWVQGASTAAFGAGITVVSLTVNSSTTATAVLNIDPVAALGARALTVTTGTETATLANAFTVTVSPASAGITVAPGTWDFGNVAVTNSSQKTFTITPTGSGALTVNSIGIAGAFFTLGNLPSLPQVVPASGISFTVTYTPLGTISSTATVTINSSAATSPTLISLSGTGTPPPLPPAGAITVATDKPVYLRTQPAQISGSLTAAGGAGIANIPVTVQVSINGSSRILNPYTDAQGNYQTTFQPGATDGGTFSVTATATSGGATRTATAAFRIVGLFINPSSLSQDLVMGTTVAVPLDLLNVGDAPLSSVTYTATVTPTGLITTSFAQTLPTLAPGGPVTIPAVLTAAAGNPPASPVTVQVKITATDSISGAVDQETSTLTITLRSAVSTLVLTPPSLSVGANPGGSLTRRFVVSNQGYAPTNNSVVTLADPVTFNWVSLGNANLGNLAAGASQEFQVLINPPASLPLGTYTVVFNVSGGTNPLQGTVTISVTRSTLGAVSFVVSDDTGAKVGGATITLIGTTNNKTFQAVTGADGKVLIDGVNASDYTYVVAATLHDPGSGAVTVTASATAQVNVILSYDVVSLTFTVTPTTIIDQYSVTLNITYSTTLPKPALKVVPYQLQYSFFPEDVPGGKAPCSLTITNTHPTANVRDISVDASQLDVNQPNGLRIHIQFEDGTSVYQIGTLAGKATTTVACYATLDGDNVPSHFAGNLVVQGTYDYTLDGNILQGTTTTNVPVTYTRPPELEYDPLKFTYDQTDPANPVLTYNGTGFVYTVRSERSGKVLNLLKASGLPFGGHNLAAFTQTQGGTTSVDVMDANQSNAFWHTDFSSLKQSLLDTGDTTTYDISTLDNGLTLLQALKAQIAANPGQVLNLPTFLGFQGKWSDRATPTGYLIPVQITTVQPNGSILIPLTFSNQTLTGGLQCLNPEDPLCGAQNNLGSFPPSTNQDGQIVIAIDQKLRLERQAFNATLGIGAKAVLSNTVASIQIRDANGQDASSKFFVLLTSDPQGATKGGTVSSMANVSWQLIPNTGAGGTLPQGTQYTVQATVHYVVNGTAKTATTQAVTITVLPSPQLSVSYTVPFVVMAGKDAKIRVSVKNVGYGPAGNLTIQSAQPRIVDTTNPNLLVGFNITGSSNTADSSGLLPGSLTLNFGNVAPGATVSGYWIVRTTRNGFFIDVSSTFTQQDYQGIQLDPVILPPTVTLVPAIGGTVTSNTGPAIPNLTVSVSQNGALIGSDQTDANGTYYIPDLAPGFYVEQVTDAYGKVWVTKNIGVLGDQGTSLINFVIAGLLTQPVTITSNPSGQSFTLAGTLYTTPQMLQLFAGSTYTINFGSGIPQGTGVRYGFSAWSDGSSANPRTITVQTSPASYSATFGTQYLLSLTPTPPGAGAITATPASVDGYYNAGTQVQLSPAPVTGHRFLAFSGALTGSTTPQSLVVDAPKSVSASFTAPVSIISTHLEPGGVPVNTPKTVQLTVRVTSVNTVIPGSINLISTDATGTPIQILTPLQPVSTQPDGSYGDYSVSIPVNESSPKTLYFEVSVAARGSLRRVVSVPIPLLVYVTPSDSELSQTVTALGNAATQFSQTRGTLGDTAALNQVSLSLQQQSVVRSVQFSADGATLRVDFNDGSIGLITADRPGNSSSSSSSSLPLKSAAVQARLAPESNSSPEAGNSVPTTGSTAVLVLAPQHALWTSSEDPSDAIYGDFSADFSTGRIASLTYLKDSDVTVDKLKQLNQYGVISVTSHGDFFTGIGSYILSGEPVTPAGDREHDLDLRLGLVVKAFNPDAGGLLGVGGGTYYAITQAFVDYYLWQGFPNSIAYLNSCRSAYDGTLASAFVRRGAGKVFGHTGLVTKAFGASAGQQLFSVLSNSALSVDQRTTAQAFAAVFPTQDLFSSIVPFGSQDPAVPLASLFTVTKSGNGTGTVTSTSLVSAINCGSTCSLVLTSSTTVTLNATADPGMKFNGWGGACALSPNDPNNSAATVNVSQDQTCSASFIVAAKIALSPFGFLDFSTTPGPYLIQVVAPNGVTVIPAPQDITVNLTKEVSSVCDTFLTNMTVVIPTGAQNGNLDFVAGMAWCNGAQQPTGTEWIINSVTMGPQNTRLATVAGQTILKIFRSGAAPPATSLHLTWKTNQIDPAQIFVRQGTQAYSNSALIATGSPSGGRFSWTPAVTGIVNITGSGSQVNVLGLTPGTTDVIVSYVAPGGQRATASVLVQVFYPIVLVHGFHSTAEAWSPLGAALQNKGLLPGDFNCNAVNNLNSRSEMDFCAVDFCDNLSAITHSATQPTGVCPYFGTLPVWGSFSSFIDEGTALKTMVHNLRDGTGADKVVILAHSMGGLASRAYIENEGGQDVDRLITIGTPHGGTPLASVISDPALAGANDIIFQGLKWLLEAGSIFEVGSPAISPAVQNMASSPGVPQQSGALHLLNVTQAPNLAPSTQYVSIIGALNPNDWQLLRTDFTNLVQKECFPVDSDGRTLPATALCTPLQQYVPDVFNLFNNFNDGLVSSDSQNLGRVVSGLPNTCSTFAPVDVEHAPYLAWSFSTLVTETSLTDFFLQVLGLRGTPICARP